MASIYRTLVYRLAKLYWRFITPLALGSRALVIREQQVLLVRLSYVKGWYLPGGGVNKRESFRAGMVRELKEECAIEPLAMSLFGLYHTARQRKIDHVAIFVVTDFQALSGRKPDPEIEEMRYFPLDSLPADATPATRRRIDEYLKGKQGNEQW
jgi:ADP-ribose pyrophosphatase YjhB (NUDIX family)